MQKKFSELPIASVYAIGSRLWIASLLETIGSRLRISSLETLGSGLPISRVYIYPITATLLKDSPDYFFFIFFSFELFAKNVWRNIIAEDITRRFNKAFLNSLSFIPHWTVTFPQIVFVFGQFTFSSTNFIYTMNQTYVQLQQMFTRWNKLT